MSLTRMFQSWLSKCHLPLTCTLYILLASAGGALERHQGAMCSKKRA